MLKIPFTAIADLRALQYRAVGLGGALATGTLDAKGLSCLKPNSGDDGTATVSGREFYVAGGAISVGDRLVVASGGAMTAASSGDISCGFSEVAVSSGSRGRGVFNFATPTYHSA